MSQSIGLVSILVRDYDEAIAFYVGVLGFTLIEDTPIPKQRKRWVVVAPSGTSGAQVLLAKASNDQQVPLVGNQTGGRVFLFLYTDDFERDYAEYQSRGVKFVRGKAQEPYGTVAVFLDLYGNHWDLIELVNGKPRPALIVQSDLLTDLENVVLCPVTSDLRNAAFRVTIEPSSANGLRTLSQVMIDKLSTCRVVESANRWAASITRG